MQKTSELYKELRAAGAGIEKRLAIGETGNLIDRKGDHITFGGTRILVASSGAEGGYDESIVNTIATQGEVFLDGKPGVGGTQCRSPRGERGLKCSLKCFQPDIQIVAPLAGSVD